MVRAFVKKNMGRSFVVALVGHDRRLGEAEFVVRLPKGPSASAERCVVLKRALQLSDQFSSGLRAALASSTDSDPNGEPTDAPSQTL